MTIILVFVSAIIVDAMLPRTRQHTPLCPLPALTSEVPIVSSLSIRKEGREFVRENRYSKHTILKKAEDDFIPEKIVEGKEATQGNATRLMPKPTRQ